MWSATMLGTGGHSRERAAGLVRRQRAVPGMPRRRPPSSERYLPLAPIQTRSPFPEADAVRVRDGRGRAAADGVSIPYDSTSYIAPVSTSKLFNDIRQCVPRKPRGASDACSRRSHVPAHVLSCPRVPPYPDLPRSRLKDDKQQETPFVVKLRSYFSFDTPKPLFRFVHPNRDLAADGSVDNSRYATVRFTAAADGLVHGVAGYFESRLFEELQLSTSVRALRCRGRALQNSADWVDGCGDGWVACRHLATDAHAGNVQLVPDLLPVHRAWPAHRRAPTQHASDARSACIGPPGTDAVVRAPGRPHRHQLLAQEQRDQGAQAAEPGAGWARR